MSKPVASLANDGTLMFWCQGCEHYHGAAVRDRNIKGALWQWNGCLVKPTLTPSVLVRATKTLTEDQINMIMAGQHFDPEDTRCHFYIKDGNIQYLSDCTHKYAGQTIPLVEED